MEKIRCEGCPAWEALRDDDGEPVMLPLTHPDPSNPNQRVPKMHKGQALFLLDHNGKPATKGHCTAMLPGATVLGDGRPFTVWWPETFNFQSCESERKHWLMWFYSVGPYARAGRAEGAKSPSDIARPTAPVLSRKNGAPATPARPSR